MKFSEFQPINEAPRINAGPAYPKPGTAQTPAPQIPPTKDEIERGLNQVPDGDSGATMSQAAKTRVDRRKARNNAQNDAALAKGATNIGQKAPRSQAKMAHSFPTQQAKKDAALSPAEFKAQQNARMTAKTGIAQPEISGSDGVNSFTDPSVIRDTQIAAKNDARPSVINSKYNDNSKLPSKPKQKYT
jgi:hypothetical protein|tara:strand:- start:71 stop:634 length:564 start_codon:yes stop_codon:yes gene_type:complete